MNKLDIQKYVSGFLKIADCEWDWTEDQGRASFISSDGAFLEIRLPDEFLCQPLTVCHLLGTDCIVGVHRTGRAVWRLCPQNGAIQEVAVLSGREGLDQGLMHHRFEAVKDRLLLLYEGGVIAFGPIGNEAWHHDHENLFWQTEVREDGNVVVKTPFGEKWQYNSIDGSITDL